MFEQIRAKLAQLFPDTVSNTASETEVIQALEDTNLPAADNTEVLAQIGELTALVETLTDGMINMSANLQTVSTSLASTVEAFSKYKLENNSRLAKLAVGNPTTTTNAKNTEDVVLKTIATTEEDSDDIEIINTSIFDVVKNK